MARTCARCGGPISLNNRVGICKRNPECTKAYSRAASNTPRHRQRSREYQRSLPDEVRQANNLRTAHGITPGEKQAMLDAQGGCCYLCGDELSYDDAVIDHDHRCCPPVPTRRGTRSVSCSHCRRGLACDACNILIGRAGDDPERLRRIADNLAAVLPLSHARIARKPEQLILGFQEAS